jgi:hypothetical protein
MMHGWGLGGAMGGGGGGFPGFHQRMARFEETYHCYSVAFADKAHLEVRVCPEVFVFDLWYIS